MIQVQVYLPEGLGNYIQAQIAAGRYSTVSDYVRELVRADQEQQRITEQLYDHPVLDTRIEEGLKSDPGRRWMPEVLNELRQQVLDREQRARKNG